MFANVIVVTSPDLLIDHDDNPQLLRLVPDEEGVQHTPLFTVSASYPLYLSGIASRLAHGRYQPKELNLGVTRFDRSGTEEEIFAFHKINAASLVQAIRSLVQV